MASFADYPFQVEYAKSGRASCKACKVPISEGRLRMAVMMQSHHFDGRVPNWFHYECFWKRNRPSGVGDIHNFDNIRPDDQDKIRSQLAQSAGVVSRGKSGHYSDFLVEYSKSGGAKCRGEGCSLNLHKGEVRLGVMEYNSEQAKMYGPQKRWYHVDCFVAGRNELGFGPQMVTSKLDGFKQLKEEDRAMLLDKLGKGAAEEAAPKGKTAKRKSEEPSAEAAKRGAKKKKVEPASAEPTATAAATAEEQLLRKQGELLWAIRDQLKKEVTNREELALLLEANGQKPPPGADERLLRIADCMAFGCPQMCPECGGNLAYSSSANAYRCTGDLTEWTKCVYVTQRPTRFPFKVPVEFKQISPFLTAYRYVKRDRIFPTNREMPSVTKNGSDALSSALVVAPKGKPMTGMTFVLVGRLADITTKAAEKLLTSLGAKVVAMVTNMTTAVITTQADRDKMPAKIADAERFKVHVLSPEFVERVRELNDGEQTPNGAAETDGKGALDKAARSAVSEMTTNAVLALFDKFQIADWGSDAKKRIQMEGNLAIKSGSAVSRGKSSSGGAGKTKVLVKDGLAVDPDSGLHEKAHVLVRNGVPYTAVLALVDMQRNTNSYYKLQLLEADKKQKYWVFRSWGRVSTEIGGNKVENFGSLQAAIDLFEFLFEDKTANTWQNPAGYVKMPGKFFPVEVDYGTQGSELTPLSAKTSKSKLAPAILDLIERIFDIKALKQTMVEFELDLNKMPLGRLSQKQIQKAYAVLKELQDLIEAQAPALRLMDASARFYSVVPHDFGLAAPPIIDNLTVVQTKCELLDSLCNIELAVSLMQVSNAPDVDPFDAYYARLDNKLQVLPPDSAEYIRLAEYAANTVGRTHNMYTLNVQHILAVCRAGETDRYAPFASLHNRQLLWHGSRVTNVAGILSQGLRIAPPEAPVTGYMFGKGIYFADMVTKSANYCHTSSQSPVGYVLLCEVALGDMQLEYAAKSVQKPAKGKHSVKGVGQTTPDPAGFYTAPDGVVYPMGKGMDAGEKKATLLYNEYIVYNVAQVRMRYLLHCDFKWRL